MGDLLDQLLARERQRTGVMPPKPAIADAFSRRHGPAAARPSALRASASPPLEAERQSHSQPPAASETPLLDALLAQMEAEGRFPPQGARPPATGAAAPVPGGLTPEARAASTVEGPHASYEQIMQALRNAHAAGDTAAAQRLAQMARGAQAREAGQPAASGAPAAPIQAQLPNGVIVEFPAGTAEDVMSGAIDRLIVEEEAKQPGWSGLTPQQIEGIRRRVEGQTRPALSPEQMGEYDDPLGQIAAAQMREAQAGAQPVLGIPGAQIPGQGLTPGLDANSYGGPPPNAGVLASLLTPEGQAARSQAEPDYDANGLPIPAAGNLPEWSLAARQAAGEGVVPFAPGSALPDSFEGRNWLRGWADDGNPATMSRGEQAAAWLNNAGEAMTLGLAGDEAAGWFDEHVLGRGPAEERTQFYLDQEAQYWGQHPLDALSAEIGGGLLMPGQAVGRFIANGVGVMPRVGRGLLAGAGTGAIYGAADAESDLLPMGPGAGGGVADRALGGILGAVTGGLGGAAITGIGQGFTRAAQALRGAPGGQEAAATVEGLTEAAQRLYREAETSGVVVPTDRLDDLATSAAAATRREGYHPRLHPRIGAVLEELGDLASAPAGLARIEIARRVAGAAARSIEPDERRIASIVIDRIDDMIEGLGDGSAALREARSLWARMSRLERIEGLMEDAANSKDFVSTMASRLRTFLRNPRNLRGFSEAEIRAMQQIARGGSVGVRALRGLADLLAPQSATGLGAMAGAFYAANPAAAIIPPVASLGARAAGNALGRSQVNALEHLVGMSDAQRAAADALLRPTNTLAPFAAAPTSQGILNYLAGPQ